MSNVADAVPGQTRTVQEYIDERPIWPDGTPLPSVPMTKMQRRIWDAGRRGEVLRGFHRFHDRRRFAANRTPI
jgi:MFS transporter, putative metabolite transport protein